MKNYQSKPRAGGGGWGGPKKFGAKDRPLFQATCSACGTDCQVPFKPVNGRPVFCRDCFKKDGDQESSFDRLPFRGKPERSFTPREERPAPRPPVDHSGETLKAINAKLDEILKTLTAMKAAPVEPSVPEKKVAKKRASAKKK